MTVSTPWWRKFDKNPKIRGGETQFYTQSSPSSSPSSRRLRGPRWFPLSRSPAPLLRPGPPASHVSLSLFIMATVNSDDLQLLWSRIELAVALPAASNSGGVELRGVARLWILPRGIGARSVRVHCRQCAISSVAVNGALPPGTPRPARAYRPRRIAHGEWRRYTVFQRAATLARTMESLVELPDAGAFQSAKKLWEMDPSISCGAHPGRSARARALEDVEARLPTSSSAAQPMLIEVRLAWPARS